MIWSYEVFMNQSKNPKPMEHKIDRSDIEPKKTSRDNK